MKMGVPCVIRFPKNKKIALECVISISWALTIRLFFGMMRCTQRLYGPFRFISQGVDYQRNKLPS